MIKAAFRELRSCKCFSLSLRNHSVSALTKIECKGTCWLKYKFVNGLWCREEGRVVCQTCSVGFKQ